MTHVPTQSFTGVHMSYMLVISPLTNIYKLDAFFSMIQTHYPQKWVVVHIPTMMCFSIL